VIVPGTGIGMVPALAWWPGKTSCLADQRRSTGVAYTREEIDSGVNAVAMSVLTYDKQPVAAVTVAGPSWRVQCDKNTTVVAELSETVSAISAHLR